MDEPTSTDNAPRTPPPAQIPTVSPDPAPVVLESPVPAAPAVVVPGPTLPPPPSMDPPSDKPRARVSCLTIALSLFVAVVAGLVGGFVGARYLAGGSAVSRSVTIKGDTTSEPVSAAAAVALPSVVNIDVTSEATSTAGQHGLPEGHPGVPVAGQGSGVAYKEAPDGGTYILTNDHVVEDATDITVTASDGETYKAELVGRDPETDMAVVRVPGEVPVIEQADSEDLSVGQMVVAIGSPYGLEHSVSSGVVSGLHRSLPTEYGDDASAGQYPLVDVIQTDAAINPGNSGGALVDRTGKLVGVNSAIYSESGSSAGIGFAIPTKTAVRIADELISDGKAKHPYLGILGQTVDETLAEQDDLPATSGALVVEITKSTKADGVLEVDDLIVALDGDAITGMDDLILAVRRTGVGETVTLTLWRDGKRIDVEMEVGDKPASD